MFVNLTYTFWIVVIYLVHHHHLSDKLLMKPDMWNSKSNEKKLLKYFDVNEMERVSRQIIIIIH